MILKNSAVLIKKSFFDKLDFKDIPSFNFVEHVKDISSPTILVELIGPKFMIDGISLTLSKVEKKKFFIILKI